LKENICVNEIRQHIQKTKNQYKSLDTNLGEDHPDYYNIGSQLLFEVIKFEIRGKTIAYASAKKKRKTDRKNY
jgi:hypothetical protein